VMRLQLERIPYARHILSSRYTGFLSATIFRSARSLSIVLLTTSSSLSMVSASDKPSVS
jgi:hypothetical protein